MYMYAILNGLLSLLLLQGLLDLESKANSDALSDSSGVEADMLLTEDTLDEFEKGNVESQEGWRDEFSQQVIKYTQHKPKKTKKASTRESSCLFTESF